MRLPSRAHKPGRRPLVVSRGCPVSVAEIATLGVCLAALACVVTACISALAYHGAKCYVVVQQATNGPWHSIAKTVEKIADGLLESDDDDDLEE